MVLSANHKTEIIYPARVEMSTLDTQLFNLKFAVKRLNRAAIKCQKEETVEKAKLTKALEAGNMEKAHIHGQTVIRKRNEALNYQRIAARVDAVTAQLETAVNMQNVSKNMAMVVRTLDKALSTDNLTQVTAVMETFEKQMEGLEVQNSTMEAVMQQSQAMSTPDDQVQSLIQQIADQRGLEVKGQLGYAADTPLRLETEKTTSKDDLSERLARLRE